MAVRKVIKAEWQRCKVHFYRNVLVHVPKRSQAEASEAMKAVFVQRDEKSAKAKASELVRSFQPRFGKAMEVFDAGVEDVLSYLHYPQPHRVRISSTNPLERLNLEIPPAHARDRHLSACRRLCPIDWPSLSGFALIRFPTGRIFFRRTEQGLSG